MTVYDRAFYSRRYLAERDKRLAQANAWNKANPERRRETQARWRAANRMAIRLSRHLGIRIDEARAILTAEEDRKRRR